MASNTSLIKKDMEINIVLIFFILLGVFGGSLLLTNLGKKNIVSNLWHSVELGALPAGLIAGLIYSFTTDVYIVYADGSHEEKNVLWSCKVKDENGNQQKISGLGLGNKFIYNGTHSNLVEYCVYYGSNTGSDQPTLMIHPGIMTEASNSPDYYFYEPESIQVDKDIFTLIYEFFAGSSEERWIIDYEDKL